MDFIKEKNQKKQLTKAGKSTATIGFRWTFVEGLIFFLASGDLSIVSAWIFFALGIVVSILNFFYYVKINPKLANIRGEKQKGTKSWDLKILGAYFLLNIFVIPMIVGLDVGRFKFSNLGISFFILGLGMYIIGNSIAFWAVFNNNHFEGTARIQKDRDHKVATSGPYRIIRHPGYLSMILMGMAMPFMIGSLFGSLLSIITTILVIIRTFLEDKMLQNELDGYKEYSKKTKYRILPFIW